jgi:hypothetical protein
MTEAVTEAAATPAAPSPPPIAPAAAQTTTISPSPTFDNPFVREARPPAEEPFSPVDLDAAGGPRETFDDLQRALDQHQAQQSVQPPRSWSREDQEAFKALPPEQQEIIAQREQERDRALRLRQNELAELQKRGATDVEALQRAQAEFENATAEVLRHLAPSWAADFSDIRSPADAQKLKESDPIRFAQFEAGLQHIATLRRGATY